MNKTVCTIVAGAVLASAADYPGQSWQPHSRAGWNETLLKATREYMADWGYSALGADGHFIAVVPREDVVAYRTVDTMIRIVIAAAPSK